jgi:predicted DNA-binding ArsR family transcriptional regulator
MPWEREFLDCEFTRTFRLVTYKTHREKVLLDKERARLPSTQDDAAAFKAARAAYTEAATEESLLEAQIDTLRTQLSDVQARKWRAHRTLDTYGAVRNTVATRAPTAQRTATFIKACPAPECKGFLSSAWKCGICELWTCPDCHELKGASRDCEHTCDPDKVATARLIAQDSRPCPKCGTMITKLEGCDQMWCTACNTGFNWRTGRIADGPIHNPHYFEYLRRTGQTAPAVGAGAGNCETDIDRRVANILNVNIFGYGYRPHIIKTSESDKLKQYLMEAWRLMREFQDYARREPDGEENARRLRVKYLVSDIDETQWKVALQKNEKEIHYVRALRQVQEVYTNAARDIIRGVLAPEHNKEEIKRQIESLVAYCNDCLDTIAKRFGRKTRQIKIGRDDAAA